MCRADQNVSPAAARLLPRTCRLPPGPPGLQQYADAFRTYASAFGLSVTELGECHQHAHPLGVKQCSSVCLGAGTSLLLKQRWITWREYALQLDVVSSATVFDVYTSCACRVCTKTKACILRIYDCVLSCCKHHYTLLCSSSRMPQPSLSLL